MILSHAEWPLPAADVCVVGAGPVGLALAFKLESRGLNVLLLEAGPTDEDRLLSSQPTDFASGHHASPSAATRQGIGGTSALWGGRCVAFDNLDFQRREHVPFSGWPIPHSEMSRHYEEASTFLQCGPGSYMREPTERNEAVLTDAVEHWSRSPVLGPVYEDRLKYSQRVTLITRAAVTDIILNSDEDRVEALHLRHQGELRTIQARQFVLGAGGLGIARLLLALQKRHPEKMSGDKGPLGRYYQGHLTGYLAVIHLTDPDLPQQLAFKTDSLGYRSRSRLQLSPSCQTEERLLNSVFWLDSISISDPIHQSGTFSLLYLILALSGTYRLLSRGLAPRATRARRDQLAKHLKNIGLHGASAGKVFSTLNQLWRGRGGSALVNPAGRYLLRYHTEQTPNPDSRVRLCDGAEGDLLSVDYRIAEEDVTSVLRSHSLLDAWLRQNGLGRLEYLHEEGERRKSVLSQAFDGYHQIGLARMSQSPQDGVVDPDCRVHDLHNLYLAGACVFPTGGHANPTLPAVALALRLGEHLAETLQGFRQA